METHAVFPYKLRYRQLLIAVFIVLFAFALRTVMIFQRAASDPSFIPQPGTDQASYLYYAGSLLAGIWPDAPHYLHPAPSYVFAGVFALFGESMLHLSLVLALLDALTVGLLLGAAWLLSKNEWAGYLSALLYVLYPVAMLYATTPLTEPLAVFLLAAFCFFILWQMEELSLWRTILLGLVVGGIALSRLNLLPIAALYGLCLLGFGWRSFFVHGSVYTIVACLLVAPITWQNYQNSGGAFIPVATTGSLELYMANNRDSAGRHGRNPALDALDLPYFDAILRDAQVAPEHFIGLLAYKFALFWSPYEPANNVSFDESARHTPILNIPINFVLIAVFGLLGFVGLWEKNRAGAILLALLLLWICLSYTISFAFGRIRFPAVIPLVLLAAGLVYLRKLKQVILPSILIALLLGVAYWLLTPFPKVPPERIYSTLPVDAIPINAQFGEVILLGWRSLDAWPAAENGYLTVNQAYTVELFWQMTADTDTRYQFYLAYIDEGERYLGVDRPLGAVSFPDWTTEHWEAGTIVGEIVGVRFDNRIPQARSGQMRVGVWYWDAAGLINSVPLVNGEANLLIQTMAVFNPELVPEIPHLPPSDLVFGEMIALRGYSIPESAQAGETITLRFAWEALSKINADYRLFLHVLDANGEIITQGDNNPVLPLFTNNWMPHYPLLGELPLTMPATVGTYQIYGGLYNENGRLSVDAPDNRVFLGEIVVE